MFFVIDKSKILSYLVALCTVIILFVAAAGLNNISSENSVMTATNVVNENRINMNNIVNSISNQNNVLEKNSLNE